MSEDYVCTLDAETEQKAKEELCEDPKERMSQVETFRKWILEQPHLRCPTGKVVWPQLSFVPITSFLHYSFLNCTFSIVSCS